MPQMTFLAPLPHRLYVQNDDMIVFSNPLLIRIQTTLEGGFTESAFNSNWLNANFMWMELMQIDLHSMRIIFVL